MPKPPEATSDSNSTKLLILLPLRAIYFYSFHYETHPVQDLIKSTVNFPADQAHSANYAHTYQYMKNWFFWEAQLEPRYILALIEIF